MSVLEPAAGIEEDCSLVIIDPALAPQALKGSQGRSPFGTGKDPMGAADEAGSCEWGKSP
jgi:hypothetical protein